MHATRVYYDPSPIKTYSESLDYTLENLNMGAQLE